MVRFERLYASHHEDVLRYCLRRAAPDEARDAAAETFAVAWRRRSDLPWERPLPWLYGVAWKVLANVRRGRVRRARASVRIGGSQVPEPGPETVLIRKEEHQAVLDGLARLRPADREILRLANWEQLSRSDVALVLGCSENAASKRLRRALNRLAAAMGVERVKGQRFFRPERKEA